VGGLSRARRILNNLHAVRGTYPAGTLRILSVRSRLGRDLRTRHSTRRGRRDIVLDEPRSRVYLSGSNTSQLQIFSMRTAAFPRAHHRGRTSARHGVGSQRQVPVYRLL
jgi:hypothetical protein